MGSQKRMILFLPPFSQIAAGSVLFFHEVLLENNNPFSILPALETTFLLLLYISQNYWSLTQSFTFIPLQQIDSGLSKNLSGSHFKDSDQQKGTETGYIFIQLSTIVNYGRNISISNSLLLYVNSSLHQRLNSRLYFGHSSPPRPKTLSGEPVRQRCFPYKL